VFVDVAVGDVAPLLNEPQAIAAHLVAGRAKRDGELPVPLVPECLAVAAVAGGTDQDCEHHGPLLAESQAVGEADRHLDPWLRKLQAFASQLIALVTGNHSATVRGGTHRHPDS